MKLRTDTPIAPRTPVQQATPLQPVVGATDADSPSVKTPESAFDGMNQGSVDRPAPTAKPGALTVLGLRIGRLFGGPQVSEALATRESASTTRAPESTTTPVIDEAGRARSEAALAKRTGQLEALIKGQHDRAGGPFEFLHRARDYQTPQSRAAAGNTLSVVYLQALYEFRDANELTSWAANLPPAAVKLLEQQGLANEYRTIVALSRTAQQAIQQVRPTGAFEEWTKHFAAAEAQNPATAQTPDRQAQCAQYASLELHRTDSFMLSRR